MFTRANSMLSFTTKFPRKIKPGKSENKKLNIEKKAAAIEQQIKNEKEEAKTRMAELFLAGPRAWPKDLLNLDEIPYDPALEDDSWVPLDVKPDSHIKE